MKLIISTLVAVVLLVVPVSAAEVSSEVQEESSGVSSEVSGQEPSGEEGSSEGEVSLILEDSVTFLSFDSEKRFTNSYYIDVDITSDYLNGEYTIYVPVDKALYFGLDSSNTLVNVSSQDIVCYLNSGDSNVPYNYSLTFTDWGTGRYVRRYYSGMRWYTETVDCTMTVVDTNIASLKSDNERPLYSMSDIFPYLFIFVMGVVIICFLMHYRR